MPETPDWIVSDGLTPYDHALSTMDSMAAAIREGAARERIWLVEHPALYTAGTSAKSPDLKTPGRFPVFETGRGGQYTYHGPGQRVVYPMVDLAARGRDVRAYVRTLERWIVACLAHFDIDAFTAEGRVGVWTQTDAGEAKIAAIGVRIRRWVTLHGFAINVAPDLTHYDGIVPCGLPTFGVTSLEALGRIATLD
ncbi:MAG: lipoyl(octanoyl) transferase LipB, partial [Pseudomonadota bacterium]